MAEDLDPFVGRTAELSALRGVLADVVRGRPQTVLLTGPAGIGKTSLDRAVPGRARRHQTPSGQRRAVGGAGRLRSDRPDTPGGRRPSGPPAGGSDPGVGPGRTGECRGASPGVAREASSSRPGGPADRRRPLGGCRLASGAAVRSPPARRDPGADPAGGPGRGRHAVARGPAAADERDNRTLDQRGRPGRPEHQATRDGTGRAAVPDADRSAAARAHRRQPAVRACAVDRASGRSMAQLGTGAPGAGCLRHPDRRAGSPHAARPRERWSRPARCWVSGPRFRWRRRWPSSTTR